MKRKTWIVIVLAMLLGACLPLAARAGDDAVAPYVNTKTDAVVHVDMKRIDLDAMSAWYQKYIDSSDIDKDKKEKMKTEMTTQMGTAKDWVTSFTKAGGKDIYIVVQISGIFTGEPGAIIVPLGEGADAAALAKVFNPDGNPADANGQAPATAVFGKNLVYAPGTMIAGLKDAKGEARPDLMNALAVGGDAPAHVAVAMAGIKQLAPMMGQAMGPGAQAMNDPAFTGVNTAGISLALPPKGAAKMTFQCKDADSAGLLVTAINAQLDKMKQDPKAKESMGENLDKFATALKPAADDKNVTMSLDQATMDMVVPSMIKDAAKAQDHGGAPPDMGGNAPPPAPDGM